MGEESHSDRAIPRRCENTTKTAPSRPFLLTQITAMARIRRESGKKVRSTSALDYPQRMPTQSKSSRKCLLSVSECLRSWQARRHSVGRDGLAVLVLERAEWNGRGVVQKGRVGDRVRIAGKGEAREACGGRARREKWRVALQ